MVQQELLQPLSIDQGESPPSALPAFVLVTFDNYRGPTFHGGAVPICPASRPFKRASQGSRTQIPLALSWATTVHKSQGLTLRRVAVHLGRNEMSPGLSYVAVSRVRKLEHLWINPFPKERIDNIAKKVQKRRAAEQLLWDNRLNR